MSMKSPRNCTENKYNPYDVSVPVIGFELPSKPDDVTTGQTKFDP
jgi:hypothetical protein